MENLTAYSFATPTHPISTIMTGNPEPSCHFKPAGHVTPRLTVAVSRAGGEREEARRGRLQGAAEEVQEAARQGAPPRQRHHRLSVGWPAARAPGPPAAPGGESPRVKRVGGRAGSLREGPGGTLQLRLSLVAGRVSTTLCREHARAGMEGAFSFSHSEHRRPGDLSVTP